VSPFTSPPPLARNLLLQRTPLSITFAFSLFFHSLYLYLTRAFQTSTTTTTITSITGGIWGESFPYL
jgi:hypothetical protein